MNALDEAAARWVARVDGGSLSPEEEAELTAWTAADPRHAGAFARAMAANAYLDRAAALGISPEPEPVAEAAEVRAPRFSRRAWLGGAAGAIAAAAIGAVGIEYVSRDERIATSRGTVHRASLADGSSVTLNSSAEIRVALKEHLRRVRLVAGEANFDVAKDPSRPFIVEAGDVRIRVVGTSFLVRLLDESGVSVTVREGIVEVRREGEAALRLTAGDCAVLRGGKTPELRRLSQSEVERVGLWQNGQIDLTGMTLRDAADAFARYSDHRIVIEDPGVARRKVAGVYSISDPAGFAAAAAQSMDLTASETPDGIRLSARR